MYAIKIIGKTQWEIYNPVERLLIVYRQLSKTQKFIFSTDIKK